MTCCCNFVEGFDVLAGHSGAAGTAEGWEEAAFACLFVDVETADEDVTGLSFVSVKEAGR